MAENLLVLQVAGWSDHNRYFPLPRYYTQFRPLSVAQGIVLSQDIRPELLKQCRQLPMHPSCSYVLEI
jgi:hypothetical protein